MEDEGVGPGSEWPSDSAERHHEYIATVFRGAGRRRAAQGGLAWLTSYSRVCWFYPFSKRRGLSVFVSTFARLYVAGAALAKVMI